MVQTLIPNQDPFSEVDEGHIDDLNLQKVTVELLENNGLTTIGDVLALLNNEKQQRVIGLTSEMIEDIDTNLDRVFGKETRREM